MSDSNGRQGARLVIANTDAEKSYWHAAIEQAYEVPPVGRRLGWWRTRIGALNKVYGGQRRYGGGKLYQFTDDDAGREDLCVLLDHYSLSNPLAMQRVIKARGPWLTEAERDSLIGQVGSAPRYWESIPLAEALNLSEAERIELGGVPTIGACDVSPAQRAKVRLAANKQRMEHKRRAAGAKPQSGSISQARPWKDEGISRAAWYRKRKAAETVSCAEQSETVSCAVNLSNTAHKPVSISESSQPAALQEGEVGGIVAFRRTVAGAQRDRAGQIRQSTEQRREAA